MSGAKEGADMYRVWKAIFWLFLCVCHRMGFKAGRESGPIFIVGLPRSGSSWVGGCLGISSSALYYREPCTRAYSAANEGRVVFEVTPDNVPDAYLRSSQKLCCHSPYIRPSVVAYPHQWPPFSRNVRVPVVKEVNPLACSWFIDRFNPRMVVVLVRHPAGIASSMRTLGWVLGEGCTLDDWRCFGSRVAREWQQMLEQIADCDQVKIVRYEDVCQAPLETFQGLYRELGLEWSAMSEQWVRGSSNAKLQSKDHFSIRRDSVKNAYRWRESVTQDQLQALMEGYAEYELPDWYQA